MVALNNLLREIDETLSHIDENDEKAKYQNIKQEFERKLQQLLFSKMEPDFYIEPEAEGNFIIGSGGVRIDCCIFPKHHLIENGFVQQWIGVEVKTPELKKARAGKGVKFYGNRSSTPNQDLRSRKNLKKWGWLIKHAL